MTCCEEVKAIALHGPVTNASNRALFRGLRGDDGEGEDGIARGDATTRGRGELPISCSSGAVFVVMGCPLRSSPSTRKVVTTRSESFLHRTAYSIGGVVGKILPATDLRSAANCERTSSRLKSSCADITIRPSDTDRLAIEPNQRSHLSWPMRSTSAARRVSRISVSCVGTSCNSIGAHKERKKNSPETHVEDLEPRGSPFTASAVGKMGFTGG